MPPLKSAELHRLARQELGPQLTALGFKRTPKTSAASWARPEGGRWLVMWLQPSQRNDAYSPGFRFTIDFALSTNPVIEHMSGWWFTTDLYDGNIRSLKTTHMYHVSVARPDVAPYVSLHFGYRFDLDEQDDVWFDEQAARESPSW